MNIAEYKKSRQPRELTAPSGLTLVVRPLSILQMLGASAFPKLLRDIVAEQMSENPGKKTIEKSLVENPSDLFEMVSDIVIAACLGVVSEETDREGEICVHLIDEETKFFFFMRAIELSVETGEKIAPFRSEESTGAGIGSGGQVLADTPKPDSGNPSGGSGSVRPGREPRDTCDGRGKQADRREKIKDNPKGKN